MSARIIALPTAAKRPPPRQQNYAWLANVAANLARCSPPPSPKLTPEERIRAALADATPAAPAPEMAEILEVLRRIDRRLSKGFR